MGTACAGSVHLRLRLAFLGVFILADGFDRDAAENALRAGHADLIAFARPVIANPDLVARMQAKGFQELDLLGFSLGCMLAQEVVLKAPLVANGDHDLAQRLPNSQLITCATDEHSAAFQFHAASLRRPRDLRTPASARPA